MPSGTASQSLKITNDDVVNPTARYIGVRQDEIPIGCPAPGTPNVGANPKQLLGPDMQLNRLQFSCAYGACSIGAHVIFYGADNTVFQSSANPNNPLSAIDDPDASCSGNSL